MEGKDEIIFTGAHKDFRLGISFDLNGASTQDVVYVLDYISSRIEPHAFSFSGIDMKKIEAFAKPTQKGLAGVCAFLDDTTPGAIKEALMKALPQPELMPVAESYLVNQLLKKAGVAFTVPGNGSNLKPAEEKPGDVIAFMAKYKDWIAIKKLGSEEAKDYEVSGILAGINHTIVNKSFDFAGAKKDESLVSSAAGGKRKSYGNLSNALSEIESKLAGSAADNAWVVARVCETLGYRPYASPQMLTEAYPDIKPPKTRGRKPKG